MHFRITVAESYAAMIGRATYNFAYLEWGVVWLGETLRPGFINEVGKLTARDIGKRLDKIASHASWPDNEIETRAKAVIARFAELTKRRDALFHGHPFTAPNGEQRLMYDGRHGREDWTGQKVGEAAAAFEDAAVEVNDLLHGGGLLAAYQARAKDE